MPYLLFAGVYSLLSEDVFVSVDLSEVLLSDLPSRVPLPDDDL